MHLVAGWSSGRRWSGAVVRRRPCGFGQECWLQQEGVSVTRAAPSQATPVLHNCLGDAALQLLQLAALQQA